MGENLSRRRFLRATVTAGGAAAAGVLGLNVASPHLWKQTPDLDSNDSFWARSQAAPYPPLTTDVEADVAIIGGGFTGLSAAYYMRRLSPKKRVVVMEAKGCGNGASGRNGAMVLNLTEDRYLNFSSDPAMDKRIYELTAGNIRTIAELSRSLGVDCELEINGALQVQNTAGDAKAAQAYVTKARGLGMPVEFWDQRRLVEAIGAQGYEGAYFDPNAGHVHPMKLVNLWKAAAVGAGADIFENTAVLEIEEGPTHIVHASTGRVVRAKSLVLATNAYTGQLGRLQNSILPVREYVAMTAPLSLEQLRAAGWQLRVPFNDSRTEVFYLGLTRDNRIHIGGGEPGYGFGGAAGSNEGIHIEALKREFGRIFPQLARIPFEVQWSGVVDWSLDESPSVGQTGRHNNVFYAIGYSGHGVNLSSVFGRILADLEAGRVDAWKAYPFVNSSLLYIPNEPFRWIAAKLGLGWYRTAGG